MRLVVVAVMLVALSVGDVVAKTKTKFSAIKNTSSQQLTNPSNSTVLRKNGKRKKTALELQISERTLYRKIKEYNLE